MTWYKLPKRLGGGRYEEYRHLDGSTEAPAGTVAFLVDGYIVAVARGLLVEVESPKAVTRRRVCRWIWRD